MKKILSLILAVLLLIPAAAPAEDRDPAVGLWYLLADGDLYPELMANIGDFDTAISVYYFNQDGSIMVLENDVKNNKSAPAFTSGGKWSTDGSKYTYRILGIGEGTFSLSEDIMKLSVPNAAYSMFFRRIIPFNPYKDYGFN